MSTANALANSFSQYVEDFPESVSGEQASDSLYLHPLRRRPTLDGYVEDWPLSNGALRSVIGPDGLVQYVAGLYHGDLYLHVRVTDRDVVYATTGDARRGIGPRYADRVTLISNSPPYLSEQFVFAAEAPGSISAYPLHVAEDRFIPETSIQAYWQDVPGGYLLEARMPRNLLGTHIGIVVSNTPDAEIRATRVTSFKSTGPARSVQRSPELDGIASTQAPSNMQLIITDASGWRIASAGQLSAGDRQDAVSGWSERAYGWLVESGPAAEFAEPDVHGREQQPYISTALGGTARTSWFRSNENGRAVVAVAAPIHDGDAVLGTVVLQQSTDAILSLTNEGLARLIKVSLIATIVAAGALLGYATWLSRRIRRLSHAAVDALAYERLDTALPSSLAEDEIGDLSRSFSNVLKQLGEYNTYLRSLASKLSHELRTPLAIVTSSLENLEHEPLSDTSSGYTARARDGADRLRRILTAMSEASRVEELMESADTEDFDLAHLLNSTATAYRDVYQNRLIDFYTSLPTAPTRGSPELLIQLLDKLIDNAVDFSADGDTIRIDLAATSASHTFSVSNPGPPLPDTMRSQLFDSLVSVRSRKDSRHLGLGLYIAKLIADGHNGRITAENIDGGVKFSVMLPRHDAR